jgi:5'-nucleotidase
MQISRARSGARILGLALAALALAVPAAWADDDDDDRRGGKHGHHHGKSKTVDLQLLGLNDFHGQLEPVPSTSSGGRVGSIPAGGAEYLATHVRALEQGVRNSLVVSAGDLIGASPLTSALFHDEPTIEAMNKIGLDINGVGNHEFDEGEQELLRMQYGGCHPNPVPPSETCANGRFRGAKFDFLAANVVRKSNGRTLFPAYEIRKVDGVKVGFIGMTLEGTPLIVSPSGISNLKFLDEAETANRYARELRRKHDVEAIVVLLHEGGAQNPTSSPINDCINFNGPLVDIVNRTTDDVDLFITGHTHQPYSCVLDGRPVTSAFSTGRVVTDIDLKLGRRSEDVEQVAVNNMIVTQDVARDAEMTSLITRYKDLAAPAANTVIGQIASSITRAQDSSGESQAGNLIADSQHEASSGPSTGQAVAAFMNPGGVRADFVFDAPAGTGGELTYGEAFSVQPFGNNLTTITLTGAQIWTMLQQQWCGNGTTPRLNPIGTNGGPVILAPSDAVRYTWSAKGDPCANNYVDTLSIGGAAVPNDGTQSYRITVNSFLADGGDGFPVLTQGTNRLGGVVDLDALAAYFAAHSPVAPPAQNRING